MPMTHEIEIAHLGLSKMIDFVFDLSPIRTNDHACVYVWMVEEMCESICRHDRFIHIPPYAHLLGVAHICDNLISQSNASQQQ